MITKLVHTSVHLSTTKDLTITIISAYFCTYEYNERSYDYKNVPE